MRTTENLGLPFSCIVQFWEKNVEVPAQFPSLPSIYLFILQQKQLVWCFGQSRYSMRVSVWIFFFKGEDDTSLN